MRRAHRLDTNHHDIVYALEEAGASVLSLAGLGNGAPDVLIGHKGKDVLAEIKSKGGKCNADQLEFAEDWQGRPVEVLRTVDQALALLSSMGP